MSDDVYLIDGARTPQGRYGGALASVRPDDLAALVVGEAVRRSGIPSDAVDEVILGAANQAGEDNRSVARMAALLTTAGRPAAHRARIHRQPAVRVRADGRRVRRPDDTGGRGRPRRGGRSRVDDPRPVGDGQARHALGPARRGARHPLGWRFTNSRFNAETTLSMGETAEELAALDGITRLESDAFALRSHRRAAARQAGRFDREIVAVPVKDGEVTEDEGPRPSTSLERLSARRTSFRRGGIVTAGNSSPLSDGRRPWWWRAGRRSNGTG